MKNLILLIIIFLSFSSASAMSTKLSTCDELSQKTGEVYYYGNGLLKQIRVIPPPTHTVAVKERPDPYGAWFVVDGQDVAFTIKGSWKDSEALPLVLAPLPIKMEKDREYEFCYRKVLGQEKERFYIDRPDSIKEIVR